MSTNESSVEKVRLALDQLAAWERRSWRRRLVAWASLLVALATVLHVVNRQETYYSSLYSDILQTTFQDNPAAVPFEPSLIKKERLETGVATSSSADIVDLVDVRNVLGALSRGAGWNEFAVRHAGSARFVFAMTILRDLQFVEFASNNFVDARLTWRGYEWLIESGSELVDGPIVSPRLLGDVNVTGYELIPDDPPRRDSFDGRGEKWYRFTIRESGAYVVRTAQPADVQPVDTVIRLFAGNQEEIAYDDDSGVGTYSLLGAELDAGEYYLGVASYYGDDGSYLISVATTDVDAEHQRRRLRDLSAGSPQVVPDGTMLVGAVGRQRSTWHRFLVVEPSEYVIRTSPVEDERPIDTVIRVFDVDEEEIGYDDDSGEDLYSMMRTRLDPGGYFLNVATYGGSDGRYLVSIDTSERDEASQRQRLRESSAGALELRPNGEPILVEAHAWGRTWYRVTVRQRAEYVVRTARASDVAVIDTGIRVYDDDWEEIGRDDNSDGSVCAMLRMELRRGTYYIQARSNDTEGGVYWLTMATAAEDRNSQERRRREALADAQAISANGRLESGRLEPGRDAWYVFAVERAGAYTITTSALEFGSGVDTIVRLYEEDGETLIAEDDDGGGKLYSRLRVDLAERSRYYVRVSGFSGRSGGFGLTVSLAG